jgi:uncharacterized protein YjbJ (UPF0337 family)
LPALRRIFVGNLDDAAGGIAGDAKAAGGVREAAGTAENLYCQAKDAARGATDAAVSTPPAAAMAITIKMAIWERIAPE